MRHHCHHSTGKEARRFGKRLYVRIWLAVLASMLLVALLAGAVWRLTSAELPREIIITDAQGQRVGSARVDYAHQNNRPAVRVEQDDGKVFYARWSMPIQRAPFGFLGWLALIVLAVGLGTYPVVKRLTRRLEQLQQSVDALGEGNLAARVTVRGHDEIAWLAERFNHAAARIETLVGAHKTLLANASHELRSPLARIRMALEMLGHQAANTNGSSAKHEAAKGEISRNIAELDQLIEEILLASRLDAPGAPSEPFEEVDLTALAAEESARGGAQLNADGVITLNGSARLLRRLLRNLIENARRHGGAAAPVDVSVRRNDNAIEIRVGDRGPGVPESERERIFEAFYRLKGTSESGGGAGLGLALVRSIAAMHGGRAVCIAREGGGACFLISLPA